MIEIDKKRIDTIFKGIEGKSVLVLGDVMLDRYLRGKVERLSPEAPVPVVDMESESNHFGGAANVALNLKTLGCRPLLVGLVGQDRNGEIFFDLLKEQNLDTGGMVRANDRPTTVKTRIIGDNQHIARVDREKIIYAREEISRSIMQKIDQYITAVDAVLIEDYNKGVLSKEVIAYVLQKAKSKDLIVTVDPKFINFMEYKGATVFKPNLKEVSQALAKPVSTQQQVVEAGRELLEKMDAQSVLLTQGAEGLSLFERSGDVSRVAARSRSVADVSGAGDTVISTMTAALTAGAGFKEAAQMANHAAGLVCKEVGIVPVQAAELRKIMLNAIEE